MEKPSFYEIQRLALQGDIEAAWTYMLENQNIYKSDIKEDFCYNTSGFSSSSSPAFVNDVLPQKVLQKDNSPETKKNVAILTSLSSAYNISWGQPLEGQQGTLQAQNFINKVSGVIDFVDDDNKHNAYRAMADVLSFSPQIIKNKYQRKEFLKKGLEASPDIRVASFYANAISRDPNATSEEKIQAFTQALAKKEVFMKHPFKAWLTDSLADVYLHEENNFKKFKELKDENRWEAAKHNIKYKRKCASKSKSGVVIADEIAAQKIAERNGRK